jgi:hypothetical protein
VHKDIRLGDRVLDWKALGSPKRRRPARMAPDRRGMVALGEVMTDPKIISDADNPYWDVEAPFGLWPRVRVRYVVPNGLPLRLGGPADAVLNKLSVKKGQGTVFDVDDWQWQALLELLGGRPLDEDVGNNSPKASSDASMPNLAQESVARPERRKAAVVNRIVRDTAVALRSTTTSARCATSGLTPRRDATLRRRTFYRSARRTMARTWPAMSSACAKPPRTSRPRRFGRHR